MSELKKTHEEVNFEWKVCVSVEDTIQDVLITFLSPDFIFAGSTMYLQLCSKFTCSPEATTLGLIIKDDLVFRSHPLQCTFGLKKLNGNVIELGTRIMKLKDQEIIHPFTELSEEIAQRSEDILHSDITFTFTFKIKVLYDTESSDLNEPKRKKLRKEGILSQNFKRLYANKLSCDVIMHVKDKEFQAHKAVLIARSKVFAAMFRHETTEKCSGFITISDCDVDTFHHFLEYLYCGIMERLSFQHAFDLYETSEKYDVLELKTFCMEQLIENFTVERFGEVVLLAEKYSDAILKAFIDNYFEKNADEIIETPSWEYLMQTSPSLTSKLLSKFNEVAEKKN